ncbi:MAG TPA: PadR family transcriptional regulator [Candidatus Acidoferrum sp.]|nr:PadR family transcriptional regulator [Candidatus Acidoferrum sp.]
MNVAHATRTAEAGKAPRPVRAKKAMGLTTPDLVLLSLLAERPMHGYQANAELERRQIRDWAAVSKPQVYYSLEKLARGGFLRRLETGQPAGGPERDTFKTTEKGREALADALEREEWTTQRDRPAFLTWLALCWQARPGVFRKQLRKRRKFLHQELAREKKTMLAIYAEVGHKFHEASWMVGLMISQIRTEILWNKRLDRDLRRRAVAMYPFSEGLPK